ncbi:MAG: hypothetical protein AB7L66_09635 [Gemmatimonadales bacterium]
MRPTTAPSDRPRHRRLGAAGIGAVAAVVAACSGGAPVAATPTAGRPCPPADTVANRWIASVVIDDRVVAEHLAARREQEFPEVFALEGPDPEPLARLPAGRIDLVQFVRGRDAEEAYRLCPGGVALLITTRSP